VLLIKEGVYADLIQEGPYASRIKYHYGGILYDVVVENEEIEYIDEENMEDNE
jgi:hypothetical protein